jgi:hypothetical protein
MGFSKMFFSPSCQHDKDTAESLLLSVSNTAKSSFRLSQWDFANFINRNIWIKLIKLTNIWINLIKLTLLCGVL